MNDQKRAISLAVLKKGKTIAGGRFPRFETATGEIDWEIIDAWATELGQYVYPAQVWEQAVSYYVNHMAEPGTVATTGDMLKAAKKVWAQWGDHPDTKEFVEQFRLKRLDAKYQRMIPGYKPGSVYPSDGGQALTDGEVIAQIAARVKRR